MKQDRLYLETVFDFKKTDKKMKKSKKCVSKRDRTTLRSFKFFLKKIYVLVSIIRTGSDFFKTSLLNVPYDPENGVLNIYKTGTYNREHRVECRTIDQSLGINYRTNL